MKPRGKSLPFRIVFSCLFLGVFSIAWPITVVTADPDPGEINPEGIEWRLVEVNGVPVSTEVGENRPSLLLDNAKKTASGFSGCNNFFCGYELEASSLKFGPVGATRMYCQELQMSLEDELFKALEKTREWQIQGGTLLLFDESGILARFTSDSHGIPSVDLSSMTFNSPRFPSGKATLSGGEYREPAYYYARFYRQR